MSTLDHTDVRKVITDAYYNARNSGGTMEDAADDATVGVMMLVQNDLLRLRAAAALRDDLLSWHIGHGDYKAAGRELDRALNATPDEPYHPET